MVKRSSIVVVAVVGIVALIAVLGYLGYIPGLGDFLSFGNIGGDDDIPDTLESEVSNIEEYSKTDIYFMLVTLRGKTLNYEEAMMHINALNMKAYGFDGQQYDEVLAQYGVEYTTQGFTLEGVLPISRTHLDGAVHAWTKGATAKAVTAGSGYSITTAYGHDTIALLAYGTYTQYVSFIAWIST